MASASSSSRENIAVIGAGCAGLAAALRLARRGCRVSLFEEKEVVGGLAGGVSLNGNLYDYGPHLFHTTDAEVLRDIQNIAKDELFAIRRTILIKFLGTYFAYPLSMKDILSKLPPYTILKAFSSFIFYNIKALAVRPRAETSETVLLTQYGKVLYELFFKSYIERVWGIPPSRFSAKFARQRIPRLSAVNFLANLASGAHKTLFRRVSTADYVENVEGAIYSTKRSFLGVAERMASEIERLGGSVHLGSKATKIKRLKDGTYSVGVNSREGSEIFDGVISTIPINNLAGILEPGLADDARDAAKKLKHRSIVFVGMLVEKEKVLPASIMYFRELSFNRITDLSYFGIEIVPKGCSLIIAEISCDKNDRFWTDDRYSRETVINELIEENIVTRKMIKEAHIFREEHAYPLFMLGFEEHLEKALKGIEAHGNIRTTGRQGSFKYVNIHIAIKMGYEAADSLIKR